MRLIWQLFTVATCLGIGHVSSKCSNPLKRCTMPECDLNGALSMCWRGDDCPDKHDKVDAITICQKTSNICCRSICSGLGTMCLPHQNPCIDGMQEVPGTCPVEGYKCCATQGAQQQNGTSQPPLPKQQNPGQSPTPPEKKPQQGGSSQGASQPPADPKAPADATKGQSQRNETPQSPVKQHQPNKISHKKKATKKSKMTSKKNNH